MRLVFEAVLITPEPPITDPNMVRKKSRHEVVISVAIAELLRAWQEGLEYREMKLR